MDNTKYYNDTLAYDFNLFMPSEKKEPATKITKFPQERIKRKKSPQKMLHRVLVFVMFSLIVINIFIRVRVNEVSEDIDNKKMVVSQLDSEKTALVVKMENLM